MLWTLLFGMTLFGGASFFGPQDCLEKYWEVVEVFYRHLVLRL